MTRPRVSDIVSVAAQAFTVQGERIAGTRGNRRVCRARLAVYYVALANGYTTLQVARILGRRDHSSVVDGRQSCVRLMAKEPSYARSVQKIEEKAAAIAVKTAGLPERIYEARGTKPAPPTEFNPTKFFKRSPKPVMAKDDELDDIELLSRAVAAHYAGGACR